MATPLREAVENLAGRPLLDWQWYAILALLNMPGTPLVQPDKISLVEVEAPRKKPGVRLQDSVEYTCELCGRVGTRRYVQTATGWRCSPASAEKCARKAAVKAEPPRPPDPKYAHRLGRGLPGKSASVSCVKPDTPQVTAVPTVDLDAPPKPDLTKVQPDVLERRYGLGEQAEKAERAAPPAPITARCQDCTRTFTLTGRVLAQAVELHELKHSHIVTINEKAQTG